MSTPTKKKVVQHVETKEPNPETKPASSDVPVAAPTEQKPIAVSAPLPEQKTDVPAAPETISINNIIASIRPDQLQLADNMTGGAVTKIMKWAQVMENELVNQHNALVKMGAGVSQPSGTPANPSSAPAIGSREQILQLFGQFGPQILSAIGGGGNNPISDKFLNMLVEQGMESFTLTHKLGQAVLNGTIQRIVPELASKVIPNPA